MEINSTLFYIIITVLVAFFIFTFYIIGNLLKKVELFEDIVQDQTEYLQKISTLVQESDKHLKNLDERGVFQSDDEIGVFFNVLKRLQIELNKFKLPSNYGKEEIQS